MRNMIQLRESYVKVCLDLNLTEDAERIPASRSELVRKTQELNFEWLHRYHIQ